MKLNNNLQLGQDNGKAEKNEKVASFTEHKVGAALHHPAVKSIIDRTFTVSSPPNNQNAGPFLNSNPKFIIKPAGNLKPTDLSHNNIF